MHDPFTEPPAAMLSAKTSALSAAFTEIGFADITPLIPAALCKRVAEHVKTAVDEGGRRRDLSVGVTGNSKRRYRLAGRAALEHAGNFLPSLYHSSRLRKLVAEITGSEVHGVPYAPEEYIATRFEEPGDTHGWHWDDYSFALVWVTAAPEPGAGGSLEFIPNIPWNKTDPRVDEHVRDNIISLRHPKSGSVYLLRADTMLHRVTPLVRAARREILCLSYAAPADLQRTISHETLEQLYTSVS